MMPVGSLISSPKALSWDAPTKKVPQIWVFQGTIGPVIVDQDQRWCRVSEPLDPGKALQRHYCERKWLDERLPESFDGNTVVVTHHGIHPKGLHKKYVDAGAVNGSFLSDLSATIERFQPAVWIHGHVHDTHIYDVGETQIACNPRGYPSRGGRYENLEGFIPDLVVEIPEWTPKPRMTP